MIAAASVAVSGAAVAAVTLAAPAYAATPLFTKTFTNSSNTSLCLDAAAPNGNVGPGARVTAFSCNGGANQKWTVVAGGTGQYVKIQNVSNPSLCLDANASNGDVGAGANVTAWPCNIGQNQDWVFLNDGEIRNFSNGRLCLDAAAPNGGVAPGANVTAWFCNGGANQEWGSAG